jgi:hypothetical protein
VTEKAFHEYHRDTQALTESVLLLAEDDKGRAGQRAGIAKLIQEIIDLRVAEERENVAKWVDVKLGGGSVLAAAISAGHHCVP